MKELSCKMFKSNQQSIHRLLCRQESLNSYCPTTGLFPHILTQILPLHACPSQHTCSQGCGSGSGRIRYFYMDPDPVFKFLWIRIRFQPRWNKKNCRKGSKSDLSEKNLKFMTKDRQKMKKATISY